MTDAMKGFICFVLIFGLGTAAIVWFSDASSFLEGAENVIMLVVKLFVGLFVGLAAVIYVVLYFFALVAGVIIGLINWIASSSWEPLPTLWANLWELTTGPVLEFLGDYWEWLWSWMWTWPG